jgi:hypothetical protein
MISIKSEIGIPQNRGQISSLFRSLCFHNNSHKSVVYGNNIFFPESIYRNDFSIKKSLKKSFPIIWLIISLKTIL